MCSPKTSLFWSSISILALCNAEFIPRAADAAIHLTLSFEGKSFSTSYASPVKRTTAPTSMPTSVSQLSTSTGIQNSKLAAQPAAKNGAACSSLAIDPNADYQDWGAMGPQKPSSRQTSKITKTTTSSTANPTYSCFHLVDPDHGNAACQCPDGDRSVVTSGSQPCPYTKPAATSSVTSRASLQYPFTMTMPDGKIIACQSSSKEPYDFGISVPPVCAGSSVIVREATYTPAPTGNGMFELASSQINVGTKTGQELATSVSSILQSLCPAPSAAGQITGCTNNKGAVLKVPYIPNEDQPEEDGELVVYVEASQYKDAAERDHFIKMVSLVVGSISQNKTLSCKDTHWTFHPECGRGGVESDDCDPTVQKHDVTMCGAPQFVGFQYSDGTGPNGLPTGWLDVHFEYKDLEPDPFNCRGFLDIFRFVAGAIAPEFGTAVGRAVNDILLVCDVVSNIANSVDKNGINGIFSDPFFQGLIPDPIKDIMNILGLSVPTIS